MKKLLAAAVAALFALSLAGCGTPAASASTAGIRKSPRLRAGYSKGKSSKETLGTEHSSWQVLYPRLK